MCSSKGVGTAQNHNDRYLWYRSWHLRCQATLCSQQVLLWSTQKLSQSRSRSRLPSPWSRWRSGHRHATTDSLESHGAQWRKYTQSYERYTCINAITRTGAMRKAPGWGTYGTSASLCPIRGESGSGCRQPLTSPAARSDKCEINGHRCNESRTRIVELRHLRVLRFAKLHLLHLVPQLKTRLLGQQHLLLKLTQTLQPNAYDKWLEHRHPMSNVFSAYFFWIIGLHNNSQYFLVFLQIRNNSKWILNNS